MEIVTQEYSDDTSILRKFVEGSGGFAAMKQEFGSEAKVIAALDHLLSKVTENP